MARRALSSLGFNDTDEEEVFVEVPIAFWVKSHLDDRSILGYKSIRFTLLTDPAIRAIDFVDALRSLQVGLQKSKIPSMRPCVLGDRSSLSQQRSNRLISPTPSQIMLDCYAGPLLEAI